MSVRQLLSGFDRWMGAPGRYLARRPGLRSALMGMAVLTALSLVLVPARDVVGSANIGLSMALVVAVVGFRSGLGPGMGTALWASALFALLHSVPHGLPRIEDEQDLVTALLLLATGALSGWVHQRETQLEEQVRDVHDELGRLHRVGEAAASLTSADAIMDVVVREVSAELRLTECFWDTGPDVDDRRELKHNGLIDGLDGDTSPDRLGEVLAEGVSIDLGPAGRLVVIGRPGQPVSSRQLKVGVILADYAAAVMSSDR